MKKRLVCLILALALLTLSASGAETIKWVDFDVSAAAMRRAMELDIESQQQEQPVSWIDILALAATRKGSGKFSPKEVDAAAQALREGIEPNRTFRYYQQAYGAVLGGLLGNYAIEVTREDGSREWAPQYGLKAFSPIAAGYGFSHYEDFGVGRSYGFARRHLGNDLMGSLGTPIVAVEGGTVEALGWNQYGGWRVGIRSFDKKRYYYYAHLKKDAPFAPGLQEGDTVQAGDLLGFMGRTGYSTHENTNNIETVHLHFGLQLIFDESQKECNSEIWIDVYDIIELLRGHQSSLRKTEDGSWERVYPYLNLDRQTLPSCEKPLAFFRDPGYDDSKTQDRKDALT